MKTLYTNNQNESYETAPLHDSECAPRILVTAATLQHERLSVRYHDLYITSHRDVAKRAIERIHADGAEHINALVY